MGFEYAATIIRRKIAEGARIRFRTHALDKMAERDFTRGDVKKALQGCRVSSIEPGHRGVTWNAEGRDIDGRNIRVVVSEIDDADESVIVITVIDI